MTNQTCIDLLQRQRHLNVKQWKQMFASFTRDDVDYAAALARKTAQNQFGKQVFFRGIIEFTNYCRNDCFYCGIRRSNTKVSRYRLCREDILQCCKEGYQFGYRTFVLQGGEDGYYTDEKLVQLVGEIHQTYPDCAITLSVGERSRASYQKLYDAGATRYLLRHETADEVHYRKLHPKELSLSHRLNCLRELRQIGYQTGCGMMVGSPGQSPQTLAGDMDLLTQLQPQMVGIGPFLPHQDTPLASCPPGSVELTLFLLSLTRLLLPRVLLPATTALGTAEKDGRQRGILAGCNVIMPNLSPMCVRKKYLLYDNKAGTDLDAQTSVRLLREQMQEIGYEVVVGRGDFQSDPAGGIGND